MKETYISDRDREGTVFDSGDQVDLHRSGDVVPMQELRRRQLQEAVSREVEKLMDTPESEPPTPDYTNNPDVIGVRLAQYRRAEFELAG